MPNAHVPWRHLHERLRAETRPLHDDLEAAVNVDLQLSSRDRYRAYLIRLWRLHSTIARSLADIDFAGIDYDYRPRGRLDLLERDLTHLGVPLEALAALERLPALTPASIAAALGCVYVVEGSALGGRAILPDITGSLGYDAGSGATFFAGYGTEEKHAWQACLRAIKSVDAQSPEADLAVEAANTTFAMFLRWLPDRIISMTQASAGLT